MAQIISPSSIVKFFVAIHRTLFIFIYHVQLCMCDPYATQLCLGHPNKAKYNNLLHNLLRHSFPDVFYRIAIKSNICKIYGKVFSLAKLQT